MMEKEGVMICVVCNGEFWVGYLKERDHMEVLDIMEYNIEMDHEDRGWECMEWINLAQDSDNLQTVINVVRNLSFQ
jgi:hypothetical protein